MSEEPTKALGRGSDTTFVPTVRAQTTEGMLEAARAEIAALRAECAMKDAALVQVRTRCHGYAAAFGLAERGEELLNLSSVKAGISEMQSWTHAALTPSDAGKRYAAIVRVCEAARQTFVPCEGTGTQSAGDDLRIINAWEEGVLVMRGSTGQMVCLGNKGTSEYIKAIAALRELEK